MTVPSYPKGTPLYDVSNRAATDPTFSAYQHDLAAIPKGISVYGYIPTNVDGTDPGKTYPCPGVPDPPSYTPTRCAPSLDAVKQEIAYYAQYGITNIYFDNVAQKCTVKTSTGTVDYIDNDYENFYGAVKGNVIFNGGAASTACYLFPNLHPPPTNLKLETWETYFIDPIKNPPGPNYLRSVLSNKQKYPQPWTQNYPASDFINAMHDVPSVGDMKDILCQSRADNVGWLYITDGRYKPPKGSTRKPYNTLPSYWSAEVSAIAQPYTCPQITLGK
jgi:hypothetical protein